MKRCLVDIELMMSLVSLLLLILFSGCATTTGAGTGTGYGSDAGPWPTAPNRSLPTPTTTNTTPSKDEPPNVPLWILFRAKSAEKEALSLDITQIDFKYDKQWVPAASRTAIAAIEALPIRATEKGVIALLSVGQIPKRKYTHMRLTLTDKKTVLIGEETSLPLTLEGGTVSLGEWTPTEPSDKDKVKTNLFTIWLDGTMVKKDKNSASLPSGSLTVSTVQTFGGISSSLDPATPNATIDAYWGASKTKLGSAVPDAQTGAFTIANLPTGSYRLDIHIPKRKLIKPLKDLIVVEDKKITKLDTLQLTEDTGEVSVK